MTIITTPTIPSFTECFKIDVADLRAHLGKNFGFEFQLDKPYLERSTYGLHTHKISGLYLLK